MARTDGIPSLPLAMLMALMMTMMLAAPVHSQIGRLMRQPGAKGPEVVEATLKVMADSCLYRDDAEFLRRLAYVESHDGQDYMTYRQGYDGGIWQIDKDKFELTQTQASKLSAEYGILGTKFGIDWSTVTWSDLLKPLYSGIAAALYTQLQAQTSTIPSDVTGQATFWQSNLRQGKTSNDFLDASTNREQNCETSEMLDILFVVDTSPNMTNAEWTQVKDYLKANVIALSQDKGLGDGGHRVAMVTYSTGALLAFLFEGATDLQSVLAEIDLAPRLSFAANLTSAFSMAETLVFPRSRPQATKVMVVLSHSQSHQGTQGAVTSVGLKSQGVIIRVIGIGSLIQQAELDTIASTPACSYATRLQSYSDLGLDDFKYSHRICKEPVTLMPGVYTFPCDHNALTKLPGDGKNYSLTISVSDGEADFLASYSQPVPTMANNERFSRLKSSSQPIVYQASNDNRTLSIKVNTDRPVQGQNGSRSCVGNFTISVDFAGPRRQKCDGKYTDTIILLDSMVTPDPAAFQSLVNFSMRYVSQFDIGTNSNRAGVATFDATAANNLIWLRDSTSLPQVLTAMRQLSPPHSTSSNTIPNNTSHGLPAALKWAREVGFSFQHGARPGSSKSIVLFTTGHPSTAAESSAIRTESQLIQAEGIRVVVVAVDKTFDDAALTAVTSSPQRVLNVTDLATLDSNLQSVTNATCGSVSVKCVENGVTRDCSPGDLVNSQYGQIVVGDRNLTANPCQLPPIPGLPEITRFPHPTKKDRFLICDRKHQAYVVLCPVGQVYDPSAKECEAPPSTLAPPTTSSTAKQPLVVMSTKATTAVPTTASTTRPITTPTTTATPISQIIKDKCTYTNILFGYRLHEYPGNRTLYINCSLTGGQGQVMPCPQGQWWVQLAQKCAYICPIVDRTTGQVDCSVQNPCDGPYLYYPHTQDRSKYIQCNPRKEALVMSCPPNQVYKPQLASCDLP